MKPYRARNFSSRLFVEHQHRSKHCGVTNAHIIQIIQVLTDCLENLYKKSSDLRDFSLKAVTIIDNDENSESQIRALFSEDDDTSKLLLDDMLKLNRLKRRDALTYKNCFRESLPKDNKEEERFLKYYMMVVDTIITVHIRNDIMQETYRHFRSIEKENRAPAPSAKNLGHVGLHKSNKVSVNVEKPLPLLEQEQAEEKESVLTP